MSHSHRIAGLIVLALMLTACGAEGRKPVFPMSGKALFEGEPMAGAMLTFHPLDDKDPRAIRSQATVDAEGNYQLTTYFTGDGAPAGDYAITIYWPDRPAANPDEPVEEEVDKLPPDRLAKSFTNPKTTVLRVKVREQPKNTLDINVP
jgi:hypothetical protein